MESEARLAMYRRQVLPPRLTRVHVAALSGEGFFVRMALNECGGRDLNAKYENDITPLHLAVEYNMLEVVMTLIGFNANVEEKTTEGFTPLFLAVRNGHAFLSKYLIELLGVDLEACDNEGLTPLCHAAEKGFYEIVKTLLVQGAHYDVKTKAGLTILDHAKKSKNAKIIELFEKIEKLFTFVKADCVQNIFDYVSSIKDNEEKKIITNARDRIANTPFLWAVDKNNILAAEILLSCGAKVTTPALYGHTALHTAAGKNNYDMVNMLLNYGKESMPDAQFKEFLNAITSPMRATALHVASQNGCAEIVELLLDNGADFNARNVEWRVPSELTRSADVREKFVKYYCVFGPALDAQGVTSRAEASQSNPSPMEASQSQSPQMEASQSQSPQMEASQSQSLQMEASQSESSQMEASQSDPSQVEASQSDPTQSEDSQMEASQSDPSQVEASQSDPSQVEASQSESSQMDASQSDAF